MQINYKNLVSAMNKILYDTDCLYRKEIEAVFNLNEEEVYYLMGNFTLYLLRAEKEVINFDKLWLINGASLIAVESASLNGATLTGAESRHMMINTINGMDENRILREFIDFLEVYKFSKFSWSDFSRMRRLLEGGRKVFPSFRNRDTDFQHKIVRGVFEHCASDKDSRTVSNVFVQEMQKRKLDKEIKFRNDITGTKVEYHLEKRLKRFSIYRSTTGESSWMESFTVYQLGDALHSSSVPAVKEFG